MDARDLVRRVRRLELSTRRAVQGTLSGRYHSRFRGRGVAFEDVRRYAPGDEVRSIDWNVTARRGELHVKRFAEERELTVLLAIDVSASTEFGSRGRSKRDAAAEVAAMLAASAASNGDRVGLLLFTSQVERFVPPRRGRRHVLRLLSEILRHEPRSRGTDVSAALGFLRRVQRRRATVFLLSDFAEGSGAGAPAWARPLAIASRRHDLVPVVVTDRGERDPPPTGVTLAEDPETGALACVDLSDAGVRAELARVRDAERAAREQVFAHLGLDAARVDAGDADLARPLLAALAATARRTR